MKERIKQARKALKMTQADFGNALGVSGNYIWMLEKGEAQPNDKIVFKLVQLLNINEEWLRSGEGEMFVPKTRNQEIADMVARELKSSHSEMLPIYKERLIKLIQDMDERQLASWRDMALQLYEVFKAEEKDHS